MGEYRGVPEEHRNRYWAILEQGFHAERGPLDAVEETADLFEPRGVFAADELVAVCKPYYLEATVRGSWETIGGLGGVATPPEHRGDGYARDLLQGVLEEYRGDGVDLVALWPFSERFYRDLGWGTALRYEQADLPPEQLAGVAGDAPGSVRQLDGDDWERLRRVDEAVAERYDLTLRRSETWWRERTLAEWPDDAAPYVYGYEVDGELAGYVLTRIEETDDGRRLRVQNLAGVDHDAELALLGFLADFRTQAETVRVYGPMADAIQDLLHDPEEATVERKQGPMIRLADVDRGLAGMDWPTDVEGTVVLDVADPLLDRNDGRFSVAVDDGTASVESVDEGRTPDAAVDVATLSRLAVGAIDVERAERFDGLAVKRDENRAVLDAAFRARPVFLREFF